MRLIIPLLVLVGCEGGNSVVSELGLVDEAPPPATTIDVLIDNSRGSGADGKAISESIAAALRHASARPGSAVRLWKLGSRPERTEMLGEVRSAAPKRRSRRARERYGKNWIRTSEAILSKAAEHALPKRRLLRSPIAEGLTRVALSSAETDTRTIIVLTDGRQVSFADLECGPLPGRTEWSRQLKRRALLQHLRNIHVRFVFWHLQPVDGRRCRARLKRHIRLQELWKHALAQGGANITFSSGAPKFTEEK